MTTKARRAGVAQLTTTFRVGRGRACRVVGSASSHRQYVPQRASLARLAAALRAQARPLFGDRRLGVLLAREKCRDSRRRPSRVYHAEGLRLRKAKRREQVSVAPVPRPVHAGPRTQWTIDSSNDAFVEGRTIRTLNVVDECKRKCLALKVDEALPSATVGRVLDERPRAARRIARFSTTDPR